MKIDFQHKSKVRFKKKTCVTSIILQKLPRVSCTYALSQMRHLVSSSDSTVNNYYFSNIQIVRISNRVSTLSHLSGTTKFLPRTHRVHYISRTFCSRDKHTARRSQIMGKSGRTIMFFFNIL